METKIRKIPRTYTLDPGLISRLEQLAAKGNRPINRQLAILLEDALNRAEGRDTRSKEQEPGQYNPTPAAA